MVQVRLVGRKALFVAIFGTAAPLLTGMLFVGWLFPGQMYTRPGHTWRTATP